MRALVLGLAGLVAHAAAVGPLIWADEFEGGVVNTSWWSVADEFDHGDGELQLYTLENVAVKGGNLVITTRRDPGRVQHRTGAVWNFSSAWVSTGYGGAAAPNFLHAGGRWEVRAILPPIGCPGAWPAHWLMPRSPCWPMGGEIDIMEMWGKPQTGLDKHVSVSSTFHYGRSCGNNTVARKNRRLGHYPLVPALAKQVPWDSEYHVFAVEWRVNASLSFFVDDHHLVTLDSKDVDVPFEPMAIILNTALDRNSLADLGRCSFPIEHKVDYVRVYELD